MDNLRIYESIEFVDSLVLDKNICIKGRTKCLNKMDVTRKARFEQDVEIDGRLRIKNDTDSHCPEEGAISVEGGVGIEKNLCVGDRIYQSSGKRDDHCPYMLIPPGTITMYAGSSAPNGYLLCDGSSYCRWEYCKLYEVIGYTYGGADNTFYVPDLRARFPMGCGSYTNASSDTVTVNPGTTGGEYTHTLDVHEMPSHNHGYYSSGAQAGQSDTVLGGNLPVYDPFSYTFTSNTGGESGNNEPHNMLPSYIGLNYIIKY